MPAKTSTFDYEILDRTGKRLKGKLDASTSSAAGAMLQAQGFIPLSISEVGTGLNRDIKIPGFGGRTSVKDLAIFARLFATMSSSGLSLVRSLAILEEQTTKPALRQGIADTRAEIEGGRSLWSAMAMQTKVFPPIMVAMMRAGETGGFLDQALDQLAINFEKDAKLRAKIKGALTYPVIVLGFSGLLIAGVLLFIVPIFEKMFKQMGGQLPLPTRLVVGASHQLWWLSILALVGGVGGTLLVRRRLRDSYEFRLSFDRLKLRIPVFGSLLTKMAISRFSRNLATLLGVGVPVLQALDVVGGTTGNAVVTEAMKDVQQAVREGRSMSGPLADHPIFPPMVSQMMEVGEETGQISAMLTKVADFYDHEVDTAADALTAAIEPLMVIFMGGSVGSMVICLYLPMFTIGQQIQGAQ